MVLCISAFRVSVSSKEADGSLVVAIGFTESSSRQLRQFSTRRTPRGRTINDGATAGFISGVLSEAGINNQCDTIAERMGLVDVLRGVVGIRTASTSTLYECRHCGTTLSADTEMCPTCGGEDVACYQF
jgi:hypothetical protein